MGISENLKAARKARGLKQTEAAAHLGVANTTLSNWENRVSRPDMDNLRLLCLLYNVRPDDIFNWDQVDAASDGSLPPGIAAAVSQRDDLAELMTAATRVSKEDIRLVTELLRRLEPPR